MQIKINKGILMKFVKHTLAIATCFYLAGCASGAQVENMIYKGDKQEYSSEIKKNVVLSSVEGGEETNPAWTSEISGLAFSGAIKQSLVKEGLYSDDGQYSLSVEMVEIDQPSFGLDMTVTTIVKYVLTEKSSGKIILDKEVNAPYTATMGDAFSGVKRLQLANEGSGQKNIEGLLNLLTELKIEIDQISMAK
jgi:hypothetical protein